MYYLIYSNRHLHILIIYRYFKVEFPNFNFWYLYKTLIEYPQYDNHVNLKLQTSVHFVPNI